MKIHKKNYHFYVVDYLEDNLSRDLKADFEIFLLLNPEIKNELEDLNHYKFETPQNVIFKSKEKLKKSLIFNDKTINSENYEDYLIAYYQGDLSFEQMKMVEVFVELNPFIRRDFKIYSSIKALPDKNLVFKNKNLLIKKGIQLNYRNIAWIGTSIAALLIVGFFIFTKYTTQTPDNYMLTQAVKREISIVKNNFNINNLKILPHTVSDNSNSAFVQIPNSENIDKAISIEEVHKMPIIEISNLSIVSKIHKLEPQTEILEAIAALDLRLQMQSNNETQTKIPLQPRDYIGSFNNLATTTQDALSAIDKLVNDRNQLVQIGINSLNKITEKRNIYINTSEEGVVSYISFNNFNIPINR